MRDRTARGAMPRRRTRLVTSLVLASLLLSGCAVDAPQSALDPEGPFAREPHELISIVLLIALVIFVLVQGLIIYSAVRFRQRKDDDGSLPAQVHGNTRLEIFWTVIPALILAAIAVPTVQMIFEMMGEPEEEFLEVEVFGHRWWWEYYYPDYDIYTANELVIPTGTPVRLTMTATDIQRSPDLGVIHSYWIPKLAGKQDVVPGAVTYLNLEADEPGVYLGQCGEFCGLSHVHMRARAVAREPAEFEAWVEEQQQPAELPEEGTLAAEGREVFHEMQEEGLACASCHQVWDGEAQRNPQQGPDLTHLMSRAEFAGSVYDITEENLEAWVADPNELKPMQYDINGIGMPDLELTEDEIDAVVAYLMTLE